MLSSSVLVKYCNLQRVRDILHVTEMIVMETIFLEFLLQGEHSVPLGVEIPVDSLSSGVGVSKLHRHVGITEPSKVG